MKKLTILILAASVLPTGASAEALWMRDVKISPDGTRIAFEYKGDILPFRQPAAWPRG